MNRTKPVLVPNTVFQNCLNTGALCAVAVSEDGREGVAAYVEKRAPRWKAAG